MPAIPNLSRSTPPNIRDASLTRDNRALRVSIGDKRALISVSKLPFSSGHPEHVKVADDGSFVVIHTAEGEFQVTAHELQALATARPMTNAALTARVGENVRRLRQERGLSLRQLGQMSGIAAPNLSTLETGRVSPRLETLMRLAEVFDVSISDLVSGASRHEQRELAEVFAEPAGARR